jgi:hypothetical protein
MEACPASFATQSEQELWKHIEVHGSVAHQEDPAKWSAADRQQIKELIRSNN